CSARLPAIHIGGFVACIRSAQHPRGHLSSVTTRSEPPLPPIINVQKISKSFGAQPLFQDVLFTVSEGDRIGLIGPNGSGKSTLLRILAGIEEPDSGNVAVRERLRLSYVEQDSCFEADETVRSVIERALKSSANADSEHG